MKNSFYFFIFVCSALVVACRNEIIYEENNRENTTINNTIPIETAMLTLENFMNVAYPEAKSDIATRLSQASVTVIGADNLFQQTKGDSSSFSFPDTLYYSINFSNNSGYAILAADKRLPEKVYAVTEFGSLSIRDLITAKEYLSNLDNNQTADSDTQSEENVESPDDGLEDDVCNEDLVEYSDSVLYELGEQTTHILLMAKLDNDAHMPLAIEQRPDESDPESSSGQGSYTQSVKYGPFLKTKWGQSDPFNAFLSDNAGNLYLAGCVNIAVSQILVANKKSGSNVFSNTTYDFNLMETVKNCYNQQYTSTAEDMVGHFIKHVGDSQHCNIKYGITASSGTAFGAVRALKKQGYSHVVLHRICNDENKINLTVDMLKKGKPVYFDGTAIVDGERYGHAWVIDGLLEDSHVADTRCFHINWGWNGNCDGYYAIGIFNTQKRKALDNVTESNIKTQTVNRNYSLDHWMIVYD